MVDGGSALTLNQRLYRWPQVRRHAAHSSRAPTRCPGTGRQFMRVFVVSSLRDATKHRWYLHAAPRRGMRRGLQRLGSIRRRSLVDEASHARHADLGIVPSLDTLSAATDANIRLTRWHGIRKCAIAPSVLSSIYLHRPSRGARDTQVGLRPNHGAVGRYAIAVAFA